MSNSATLAYASHMEHAAAAAQRLIEDEARVIQSMIAPALERLEQLEILLRAARELEDEAFKTKVQLWEQEGDL